MWRAFLLFALVGCSGEVDEPPVLRKECPAQAVLVCPNSANGFMDCICGPKPLVIH